jgi:branched-chain amino acid transport system ATP-binding protein
MSNGLKLAGVDAFYGEQQILHGIDLFVAPGQGIAIVGRNGVGKTSLLRSIVNAFGVRYAGDITVDGVSTAGRQPDQIARLGVAFVPSDRRIFPLTVQENLQLAAAGRPGWMNLAKRALSHFPFLLNRMTQKGDTLSGGEQQALAIVRAVLMQPRYMLLDEPSEGLAPVVASALIQGIRGLQQELSVGIVLAERNLGVISALCSEVRGLVKGSIVHSGSTEGFINDPKLQLRLLTPSTDA